MCFDTLAQGGEQSRTVVPLAEIATVKKVFFFVVSCVISLFPYSVAHPLSPQSQFAKFLPGSGHSLQVTLRGGDVLYFSGFADRDAAFAALSRDTSNETHLAAAAAPDSLAETDSFSSLRESRAPAD
jgi:hypothetical protein